MKRLIALIAMLLSTISCMKDVDFTPTTKSGEVSLSCILTDSDVQTLNLTYSNHADEIGSYFEEVTEATVTLFKGDEAVGSFTKSGYGVWQLQYRPIGGETYKIVAEVPGHPTVSATTTMPRAVEIRAGKKVKGATIRYFSHGELTSPLWFFGIQSSIDESDFTLPGLEGMAPQLKDDIHPILLSSIKTNHPHTDHLTYFDDTLTDTGSQLTGALAYEYYVRIPAHTDGYPTAQTTFGIDHNHQYLTFTVFRIVSEEYDKYLRRMTEKVLIHTSEDDPAVFFDQDDTYSNIKGGLGIFGAYVETSFYTNHKFYSETPGSNPTNQTSSL